MRQIEVSTDVFAAIWAARKEGEVNEDQVLRRILGVKAEPAKIQSGLQKRIGFSDPRFGIELEEGFEIFRIYLGREYRAQAFNGGWKLLNDGKTYPSLNQLSRAIGTKIENAWNNWYFTDETGQRQLVTYLRKKVAI